MTYGKDTNLTRVSDTDLTCGPDIITCHTVDLTHGQFFLKLKKLNLFKKFKKI